MIEPSASTADAAPAETDDAAHAPAGTSRAARLGPLIFFLVLVGLGAMAVIAMVSPPRRVAGLTPDPDVEAARALVGNRLDVRAGGLRFDAALLGTADPRRQRPVATADAIARAGRHLMAAQARHPYDARVLAALAALDLATLRLERAQRRYREALDLAPEYPEARLGLGVALAMSAETQVDAGRARGLRLRAIAQFRAVPDDAPERAAALFDGAIVLAREGRTDEAERWARDHRSRDPEGRWADALRVAMAQATAE